MKRLAIYELGKEVHQVILDAEVITRVELNAQFKTTTDDKRNDLLTAALWSLITLGYIKRHRGSDGQVFFWHTTNASDPYPADKVPAQDDPVDVMGPPPVEEKADQPVVKAVLVQQPTVTPDEKKQMLLGERLTGTFKQFYDVMAKEPHRLYGRNDLCFASLQPDAGNRGRALGRMYHMGVIRKALDAKDDSIVFYTLTGVFPPTLVEQVCDSARASKIKKRADEGAHRKALIDSFVKPTDAGEDSDDKDSDEIEDPDQDTVEGEALGETAEDAEDGEYLPDCTISSRNMIVITRRNGDVLELDEEESAVVVSLFSKINFERM